MFARYFVELPIPADDVERALSRDPRAWLPGLAEQANYKGDRLLAEVGIGGTIGIHRTVLCERGAVVHATSKSFFSLRWTASGHPGLFPALDADIEVAPLGADRAQLAMSARYTPPLGAVGRTIDRALLSRVAEATVKDVLDRVADAIVSERAAPALGMNASRSRPGARATIA
jgi:hypothetical protein